MESISANLHIYIIVVGIILAVSVYASRLSERFGVPLLIIFLALGMFMGSEGFLGISFDNPILAQTIGSIALLFILYDGGLATVFSEIKPVIKEGAILATVGVLVTALVVALFSFVILDFDFLESLLLGAIVSSTDAAAVFAILRTQNLALKNNISPLLELESGSNDPMAIFLTLTVLQIITLSAGETLPIASMLWKFAWQFIIGGALGILFGYLFPRVCQRFKVSQPGLYPLLSVAWLLVIYGCSTALGGNGFLTIYLAGIVTNRYIFPYKQNIMSFHDAIAWMMQIIVFLTLGLLVFPSQLPSVAIQALLLAFCLIFIARPIGVFLPLIRSKFSIKEKLFISWVGLRGAVPIVLATYPFVEKLPSASLIFDVVFFMVIVSVLLQGSTLPLFAKLFGIIENPQENQKIAALPPPAPKNTSDTEKN
ncbi:K+/H+ antiporter [Helicobacter monodelphidis]|uniref:potassium/proton antiporter n=1 Tax=Helicobacter sp. 15-1451 TaxID=2004995 RepID=UPI000DCD27C7|nr:potassium/proton antiporter [Helicobacter sp. 15-1451]RAX58342.1 K+/H+ antiporter [Helicobacter sp. 15-1451]